MRIIALNVHGFRNLQDQRLEFSGSTHFMVGANGQGKTNLLEAIGLLSALRSFRVAERKTLVNWNAAAAAVHYRVDHDKQGVSTVEIALRGARASVSLDGERLRSLGDFVGLFPTVALSSHDIEMLRSGPSVRRRFIDICLSGVDFGYLAALRGYHRGLVARNRLLKGGAGAAEVAAFSREMAPSAALLVRKRRACLETLDACFREKYQRFAPGGEHPVLVYSPDVEAETEEEWLRVWRDSLERDRRWGATLKGPHRDDFQFRLFDRAARTFASEGQQRGIVTALRLGQAQWVREVTGERPVVLADDVLVELDPARRRAFWAALDPEVQIFASGTETPRNPEKWEIFSVAQGLICREGSPA